MSEVYRCYVPKKFSADVLDLIGLINKHIADYAEQGLTFTLRQLHYKLTDMPDYPNTDAQYKRLGDIVSDARLAGLISWTAIVDLERDLYGKNHKKHPLEVFKNLDKGYSLDKWVSQPWYPEVWVEKKGQLQIVGQVCDQLEVNYFATKGYNSQTEQWKGGQRLARAIQRGQRPIIFYFGDYDPSGLDMIRDNQERLSMFAGQPIIVQPLALTRKQVDDYDLPENPLKLKDGKHSDSRAKGFIREHGYSSWELDALDPKVIQELISGAIMQIRDETAWEAALAREVDDKRYILELIDQLGLVTEDEDEDDEEN